MGEQVVRAGKAALLPHLAPRLHGAWQIKVKLDTVRK